MAFTNGNVGNQAAAQATTLEYGNTASLRAVVESCSALTNARLVHLMMGPYRLKAHLRLLKKFLLHGQVKGRRISLFFLFTSVFHFFIWG